MPKSETGCYVCKHSKPEELHGRREVRCLLDNMLVMRPSTGCPHLKKKAVTNGDKLRGMTNEQLAAAIDGCNNCIYKNEPDCDGCRCYDGRLAFLNEEVSDGET